MKTIAIIVYNVYYNNLSCYFVDINIIFRPTTTITPLMLSFLLYYDYYTIGTASQLSFLFLAAGTPQRTNIHKAQHTSHNIKIICNSFYR